MFQKNEKPVYISFLELMKRRKVRTLKSISNIQINLLGLNLSTNADRESIFLKCHYVTISDDDDEI